MPTVTHIAHPSISMTMLNDTADAPGIRTLDEFPVQTIKDKLAHFLNHYVENNGKHLAQVRNAAGHPCLYGKVVADFIEVGRERVIVHEIPKDPALIKSLLNALCSGHHLFNSSFGKGLSDFVKDPSIACFYRANKVTGKVEFNRSYKLRLNQEAVLPPKKALLNKRDMIKLKERVLDAAGLKASSGSQEGGYPLSGIARKASIESLSETDGELARYEVAKRQRILSMIQEMERFQEKANKQLHEIEQLQPLYQQLQLDFPELRLKSIDWIKKTPAILDTQALLETTVPQVLELHDQERELQQKIQEQCVCLKERLVQTDQYFALNATHLAIPDVPLDKMERVIRTSCVKLDLFEKPQGLTAKLKYLFKAEGLQVSSTFLQRLLSLVTKDQTNNAHAVREASTAILDRINNLSMLQTEEVGLMKKAILAKPLHGLQKQLKEHYILFGYKMPIRTIEWMEIDNLIQQGIKK